MTGLRAHHRDRLLPERAGDTDLVPPTDAEFLDLIGQHMLVRGASLPIRAELCFARWKPETSIAASYDVHFADGTRAVVHFKRHRGEKFKGLSSALDERPVDGCLLPVWSDIENHRLLWTTAADRTLGGISKVLDMEELAKIVHRAGVFGTARVRRRRSSATLLRYKPERRAVLRLDLGLRQEGEEHARVILAARVHPPVETAAIAAARSALARAVPAAPAGSSYQPEVVAVHERYGILLERWLSVEAPASPGPGEEHDFSHVEQAGSLLAALHAVPVGTQAAARAMTRRQLQVSELLSLFSVDGELAALAVGIEIPEAPRVTTWVHGDFHPDQVAAHVSDGSFRLLDFDNVGLGDPAGDLASWIADRLYAQSALGFDDAAQGLLAAYARSGGQPIEHTHLRRTVAVELARRSAASVRRLEDGAVTLARQGLETARRLLGER